MEQQHTPDLPLIDRIKIGAEFLVPIFKQMEEVLGRAQAQSIMRKGASTRFRAMARDAVESAGGNGGRALMKLNEGVRQGVDIITDGRPQSDGFSMDVTACVYARFFQELGEPELGFLLVCSADFDVVEEMDDVELTRSQTLMEGADHCDFEYRFLSQ